MITSTKSQFVGYIDRVIFEDESDYEMAMEILLTIEHHFGECYSMLFVEWLRQKIKITDDEINLRIADTFEKSSIEYKVGNKTYKEFFGETYFRVQKGMPNFITSEIIYAEKKTTLVTLLNPRTNVIEIIRKLKEKTNVVMVDAAVRTGLCQADKTNRFFIYCTEYDIVKKAGQPHSVTRFIKDANRKLYDARNLLVNSYLYPYELDVIDEISDR